MAISDQNEVTVMDEDFINDEIYKNFAPELETVAVRMEEFNHLTWPDIPKLSELRLPKAFWTKPDVVVKHVIVDGVGRPKFQRTAKGRGRIRNLPTSQDLEQRIASDGSSMKSGSISNDQFEDAKPESVGSDRAQVRPMEDSDLRVSSGRLTDQESSYYQESSERHGDYESNSSSRQDTNTVESSPSRVSMPDSGFAYKNPVVAQAAAHAADVLRKVTEDENAQYEPIHHAEEFSENLSNNHNASINASTDNTTATTQNSSHRPYDPMQFSSHSDSIGSTEGRFSPLDIASNEAIHQQGSHEASHERSREPSCERSSHERSSPVPEELPWPQNRPEVYTISDNKGYSGPLFPDQDYSKEASLVSFIEQPYMWNQSKGRVTIGDVDIKRTSKKQKKKPKIRLVNSSGQDVESEQAASPVLSVKNPKSEYASYAKALHHAEPEPIASTETVKAVPTGKNAFADMVSFAYRGPNSPQKTSSKDESESMKRKNQTYDLILENIPEYNCSQSVVNEIVEPFGTVLDIDVSVQTSDKGPVNSARISYLNEDDRDWAYDCLNDPGALGGSSESPVKAYKA